MYIYGNSIKEKENNSRNCPFSSLSVSAAAHVVCLLSSLYGGMRLGVLRQDIFSNVGK
jgi:hypothetical protein